MLFCLRYRVFLIRVRKQVLTFRVKGRAGRISDTESATIGSTAFVRNYSKNEEIRMPVPSLRTTREQGHFFATPWPLTEIAASVVAASRQLARETWEKTVTYVEDNTAAKWRWCTSIFLSKEKNPMFCGLIVHSFSLTKISNEKPGET